MGEKAEAILITKTGPSERTLKNLRHLPVNSNLIETLKPLAVGIPNRPLRRFFFKRLMCNY